MEQNQIHPDEISLKNFILKIKEYYHELLKNWWLLLLLAIPFAGLLAYQAISTPEIFPAKMTFMVNEESKGGGGVGGILTQFGLGGSGGGDGYNLAKVMELSKSREIAKQALFTIDSSLHKKDFLINEVIRVYDLQSSWAEYNSEMADFVFEHDDFSRFTRTENNALKGIHVLLVGTEEGGGILKTEVNNETSIFEMVLNSREELLGINLLKAIYEALGSFYIKEAIEKPKTTYDNLKARTDSVKNAMMSLEYQLAKNIDSNRGLVTRQAKLERDRLERKVRMATIEYGKLIENLGTAEFSLENATPIFQVIDPVLEPIKPKKESLLKAILVGGFIGLFLGIVFIILRKVYRDAMLED